MKKTIYIFTLLILTSCSSTITLINKTNDGLSTISVLSIDDRSDKNFGYSDFKKNNILTKELNPNEKIKIQKEDNIGIIAVKGYNYYFNGNIKGNKVRIDASLSVETNDFAPMVDPDIITVQIKNSSNFYINEITFVMQDRNCGPNKKRYEEAMEFWRIIKPNANVELKYEYYPPCPYSLAEIIVKGYLEDDVFEQRFSSNLGSIEIINE